MNIPQLVQYQGSKRKLAEAILSYMPRHVDRLVEPFCGSGAISIASSLNKISDRYWLNDVNEPLVKMLEEAIENPEALSDDYQEIWNGQFKEDTNNVQYFYDIRNRYNSGDKSPAITLFLIARCVKGAVRYSEQGLFNQSPDKRRNGTNPSRVRKNTREISYLLKGRAHLTSLDYRDMIDEISENDFLYMDPPYQGVSNTRDHRYIKGVQYDDLVFFLEALNKKGVRYLLSYDGACGDRQYGRDLPPSLGCKKILLDAGRSTQSTFLGKSDKTVEALYLSPSIMNH